MQRCVFIVGLFFFLFSLKAQKVGLVLSGGGAKGLAHIGVIKALEDNGIPIDYIAGTSMGAIIGGLYAAGYSPEDMINIVTSPYFLTLSTGIIDKKYKYYFKAPEPDASWISLKFSKDSIWQTSLPTNIVSTYNLDFALIEYFAKATAQSKGNFDSLFVPFRCVASDVEASKAFVFRSGDLGKSIRASMTFPFYFKPITIDGKLFFDGGIYNNFPADILQKEFNPDYIIGSCVVSNYSPPNEDNVFTQLASLITENTDYSIHFPNSTLIRPVIKGVSLLEMEKAPMLIDLGYKEAMKHIDSLKAKIPRQISPDVLKEKREKYKSKLRPLVFDKIRIKGVKKWKANYVEKHFEYKSNNISLENLKNRYFRLVADEQIDNMMPTAKYNDSSGFYDMDIDVRIKNKLLTKFGGNMSSSSSSQAFGGLEYRILRNQSLIFNTNFYFGKFYSSGQIKTRIDVPLKLPFYVEGQLTFNNWDYFKSAGAFYQNIRPSYIIRNEQHSSGCIALPAGRLSKISSELTQGSRSDYYYFTENFLQTDTADKTTFNFVSASLQYERNSLNYKQYPDAGTYILLQLKQVYGKEINNPGSTSPFKLKIKDNYIKWHDWARLKFILDSYIRTIKKVKVGIYIESIISTQTFFNNYYSSILAAPAFQPIPESKTIYMEHFRAHSYLGVGLKTIFEPIKKLNFRLEWYFFQPYEKIKRDDFSLPYYGKELSNHYYMGSAALVYHTPVGPVSLSLNYYNQFYKNYSLMFNFGYIIFNKAALD